MTTVADHLARISARRFIWAGLLAAAWVALVIIDITFGIAKHEWIGFPAFVVFVAAFIYLGVFAPPRCPACRAAIHAYSFRPYPKWVPSWFARLVPRYKHCLNCGLAFSTPLNEVGQRAL
jgi:hypothetical protein